MYGEEARMAARAERQLEREFRKKETLDLTKEDDVKVALRAEKRREPSQLELEKFKSAVTQLNLIVEKANGMDERLLLSMAEMIEKKDASGLSRMFDKNIGTAKAANAIIENKEMCDFVIKNAYAGIQFRNEFGEIKNARDLLKVQANARKDPKFKALIDEFRKDEKFKATADKTDPLIMFLLMKSLLPNLMSAGMSGGALASLIGKVAEKLGINVAGAEKSSSFVGRLTKAAFVLGTPDGFALLKIMGGMEWKA